MARLISIGGERSNSFEFPQGTFAQDGTASHLFANVFHSGGSGGTADPSTGGHSYEFDNSGSNPTVGHSYVSFPTATTNAYYIRVWLRVDFLPSTPGRIITHIDSNGNAIGMVTLNNDGTLVLKDANGQIGAASVPVQLTTTGPGNWQYVELYFFNNLSTGFLELEGRLNGSAFATSNTLTAAVTSKAAFGMIEQTTGYSLYFDDIAVNDSQGTYANSWIGGSSLAYIEPNAAGANTGWTRGGAVDSGANWTQVYNQGISSWITATTLNTNDDYAISFANIPTNVNINYIDMHVVHESAANPATATIKIRVTQGGTTNLIAVPAATAASLFNTTFRLNPATGVPFTQPQLASTQIGVNLGTQSASSAYQVNMLWGVIDYTTVVPPNVYDTTTVTDAVTIAITTPIGNKNISVFDLSTVTEATSIAGLLSVSVSDSSTVTESFSVAQALAITLLEFITVDEGAPTGGGGGGTSGTPIGILAGITQATGGSGGVSGTPMGILAGITQTGSGGGGGGSLTPANGANVAIANVINLFETSTVTDAVFVPNNAVGLLLQDVSTVTDAVTITPLPIKINVFDSSIVVDVPSLLEGAILITATETSAVTDTVSMALTLSVSVSDSSTVTENDSVAQALAINNNNTTIGMKLWR